MSSPLPAQPATIFIVDDDFDVRRALGRLLRAAGFKVITFGSAREFLAAHDPQVSGCLILDVTMPDVDGFELQESLRAIGCERPIIFLTGSGDVPTTQRALRAGAVTFLAKPVEDAKLFAAVNEALQIEAGRRARS
jgi:FixJ family two-component response regulator